MAARRVKCQDTGEYSTSDVAYKAENGKYYSSQAAYSLLLEQKEDRQRCVDLMFEVLNYQSWMKLPTFFFSKLKTWEPYGYKVVYDTINGVRQNIEWALQNKRFADESKCVVYVCAIIENHLNDYYKLHKREQQAENKSNRLEIDASTEFIPTQRTRKDISSLLGDIV